MEFDSEEARDEYYRLCFCEVDETGGVGDLYDDELAEAERESDRESAQSVLPE